MKIRKIILIKYIFVVFAMLFSNIMLLLTEEQIGIFTYFMIGVALPSIPLLWGRWIYIGLTNESTLNTFFSYKTFQLIGVLTASFFAFATLHYMYRNYYTLT